MRNVIAVIAGIIAALLVFYLSEFIVHRIHPMPADIDIKDPSAVKNHILTLPVYIFLLILLGYAIGSFLAGVIIRGVSQSESKTLPLIAGFIFTISAIVNLVMYPHPVWFMVLNILLYIPFVLLGHSVGLKNKY